MKPSLPTITLLVVTGAPHLPSAAAAPPQYDPNDPDLFCIAPRSPCDWRAALRHGTEWWFANDKAVSEVQKRPLHEFDSTKTVATVTMTTSGMSVTSTVPGEVKQEGNGTVSTKNESQVSTVTASGTPLRSVEDASSGQVSEATHVGLGAGV